jgi:hypothetical protein
MRTSTSTSLALIALASLLIVPTFAGIANAGEVRTHDGFFLRLSAGAGSASAKIEPPGGSLEFSGTASDINIGIGGRVSENLLLHGTLWGWALSDPDFDLKVTGGPGSSGTATGMLTMSAVGIGATYYFMPVNMYMSGSIGTGSLTGDKDMKGNSKSGLALDFMLGKEWWVGDSWGLGVAGYFDYFSAKDDDILGVSETWKGPAVGVRLSGTFN